MKIKMATLALFLLHSIAGKTQDRPLNNYIGFDVIPGIALTIGVDIREMELSYIKELRNIDLRFKINMNNNALIKDEVIDGFPIEPDNGIEFISRYNTRVNYMVNLGVAKRVSINNIDHYFGFDGNLGLNTGDAVSIIDDIINPEDSEFIGEVNNRNYVIGLTPFIGSRFLVTHNFSIDVEFGWSINYNFGKHQYLDQNAAPQELNLSRGFIGFGRLLNDIRFSYYF
ncbi:MAG: hypothetical protein AAF985_02925 [Bacteroidota bacterium]